MEYWLSRTRLLVGEQKLKRLQNSHVLVAGMGGVGSAATEMLCRSGIGRLTLADADNVTPSNRNRQLHALRSTEGKNKAVVMQERMKDINPDILIDIRTAYLDEAYIAKILAVPFDYVVDAIDTVAPKVSLITHCVGHGIRLVSSMGSGGRLDPSLVRVADISLTSGCNLAQEVRKRLHGRGIYEGFKAVFSPEPVPSDATISTKEEKNKKTVPGSISYVPVVFGCYCAWAVVSDLTA
jgi:tRNA A37 threonylcarbamoyladenosine dehydratase